MIEALCIVSEHSHDVLRLTFQRRREHEDSIHEWKASQLHHRARPLLLLPTRNTLAETLGARSQELCAKWPLATHTSSFSPQMSPPDKQRFSVIKF
jgi:demethoxyubiquinone hydroxylase (CLK1/Coq7/Cat5 family)